MSAPSTFLEEPHPLAPDKPASRAELRKRYRHVAPGSPREEELVKQHLPLVKHVVGRLAMTLPAHVDLDDLHSAGLVGLLNAVRQFDPDNGTAFETYARLRIRGAIFDELRRLDWVPRSVHAKARRVQTVLQELEQQKGEIPTNAEMARALKLSLPEYEELLEEIRPVCFVCLDSAHHSGEGDTGGSHYETVSDPAQQDPVECTSRRELARLIAERLEQLPEMQRKVLALYYFEDLRLREIAEVFGLTESRICQIHAQAILAIKSYLQRFEASPN
ncbi:MAG: FliA/WhiG family RNA polymerase sigma factor [Verrucomicrobia bacterium]|nr:FliA/WhiG family RNA polymerase sigma factor [Verrucomicrobiota bacterium]